MVVVTVASVELVVVVVELGGNASGMFTAMPAKNTAEPDGGTTVLCHWKPEVRSPAGDARPELSKSSAIALLRSPATSVIPVPSKGRDEKRVGPFGAVLGEVHVRPVVVDPEAIVRIEQAGTVVLGGAGDVEVRHVEDVDGERRRRAEIRERQAEEHLPRRSPAVDHNGRLDGAESAAVDVVPGDDGRVAGVVLGVGLGKERLRGVTGDAVPPPHLEHVAVHRVGRHAGEADAWVHVEGCDGPREGRQAGRRCSPGRERVWWRRAGAGPLPRVRRRSPVAWRASSLLGVDASMISEPGTPVPWACGLR